MTAVRSGYDRWSTIYDDEANPLITLEEPAMRAAIGDPRGVDVLDLGCGTGRHSLRLAAAGAAVTAIDFSDGMLAKARAKPGADRIRFLSHDLHERLPLADDSFDLVVSGLMLEHLAKLDGFFSEIRRVLRPGGRAVLSTMHPAMFLRGTMARFTDPATGEKVVPGSVPHSISDFVMAAIRAGLRLTHIEEAAADEELVRSCPRAEKYVGWPTLVVMTTEKTRPRDLSG
jgi:malonyl-CoA O-methyltransferase